MNATLRRYYRQLVVFTLAIVVTTAFAALLLRPSGRSGANGSILPGLSIGQPAPAFALSDLSGKKISLGGYRGHWLLVNFWGVTCVPCRSEMPALEAAYRTANERASSAPHPVILGIDGNVDAVPAVTNFVRARHVTYPIAVDALLKVVIAFHVGDIPSSVLIDPAGKIRAMHLGPLDEHTVTRYLRGDVGN